MNTKIHVNDITRKLNGRLTDRAKLERKYYSSILGLSNTTEYHQSYLARIVGRDVAGLKRLIAAEVRQQRITASFDGSTVIFA